MGDTSHPVMAGLVPAIHAAPSWLRRLMRHRRLLGVDTWHKAGQDGKGWPRLVFIATAVLLPSAAIAQGCGPTRLKVTEIVVLDLPPAKAWALVGDFQDMSWDVETVSTKGSGGNMPDKAVRAVTLRDGTSVGESLYKYDAATMSYSYHIDRFDVTRLPVQNISATLEVVPQDGGAKSLVRWRGAFYRYLAPGEPAPDVADANAARVVSVYLKSGLAGLKKAGAS